MKRISVLVFLVLTSCSARQIREAQDLFNRAAAAENQSRPVSAAPTQSLMAPAEVEALYRSSLALLEKEIANKESNLREEGLWPTARLLKALCLWRIAALGAGTEKEIEAARQEVVELENLEGSGKFSIGTRDRLLIAALPGLIDHELGLRADSLGSAEKAFRSAVDQIEKAVNKEKPAKDHDVRLFLRLAQMSSLRQWMKTIDKAGVQNPVDRKKEPFDRFVKVKDEVKSVVEEDKDRVDLRSLAFNLTKAAGVTW